MFQFNDAQSVIIKRLSFSFKKYFLLFLNFVISKKNRDKIYKKLIDSNGMSQETQRHLKPMETRPGIKYTYIQD